MDGKFDQEYITSGGETFTHCNAAVAHKSDELDIVARAVTLLKGSMGRHWSRRRMRTRWNHTVTDQTLWFS